MAQRLYMILLEDDPEEPGFDDFEREVKHLLSDGWDNAGYSAMQAVLDVEEYDRDGSDGMELIGVLGDLQAEIQEDRGGASEEDFDPEDPMGIWSGVAESEGAEDKT